jgi:hypothetical protein
MLRKQATALSAHRISFKYVIGGGSSHEPRIVHHIESGRQLIHRLSASRKRNSLLTHIFSRAGAILYHLRLLAADEGDAGLRRAQRTEAERWTRSG